jgi:hypothetical protein
VLFDPVYVLKSVRIEPLALSNELNLVEADAVNVFKLPVVVSNEVNLLFCVVLVVLFEPVYELKSVLIEELAVSNEVNLPLALDVKVLRLPVLVCNVPIMMLFEPV